MSTPCEKHALLPVVGQSPCAGCEIEGLRAENNSLLTALKGMTSMYAYCWDLVDGGLLCMQHNVQRFEDAHEAAQKVVAAMSKDPLASKEKQND